MLPSDYTLLDSTAGCLQLLEKLEISWNLKTLLEISWKLIGPPGNFCARCRKLTTLVSSHKIWINIPHKNTKFIATRCVPSTSRCTKTRFQPGLCHGPLWGSLWRSPRFLFGWGGDTESWNTHSMGISALGVPSEGGRSKANMSWIFLIIPPGFSWKFAWLNL